jgi:hypothetical protein
VSDFFTKLLLGSLFCKLHRLIMNSDMHDHDHENHKSVMRNDDATEHYNALGRLNNVTHGPVHRGDAICIYL